MMARHPSDNLQIQIYAYEWKMESAYTWVCHYYIRLTLLLRLILRCFKTGFHISNTGILCYSSIMLADNWELRGLSRDKSLNALEWSHHYFWKLSYFHRNRLLMLERSLLLSGVRHRLKWIQIYYGRRYSALWQIYSILFYHQSKSL